MTESCPYRSTNRFVVFALPAWLCVIECSCSQSDQTPLSDGGSQPADALLDSNNPLDGASEADLFDAGADVDASDTGAETAVDATTTDSDIDDFIVAQMQIAHVPGLGAAVVAGGQVQWVRGYGLAEIATGRQVDPDTLFMLASVSKTVTGTAVMQLMERGQITLDDDIDDRLPFPVRNPNHPTIPITYRMLLSHTSSIRDGASMDSLGVTVGQDAPVTLADWAQGYFTPGGTYWGTDNFAAKAPGTSSSYCNAAVSLAGYLVEIISAGNLQQYSQPNIFAPLGMTESSWFVDGLDLDHVAMPYEFAKGQFTAQGQYTFPDYPDGQLRTSAAQLARFLLMFMNFGQLDGARVLQQSTVEEMRRIQYPSLDPDQGLIWYFETGLNGERVLGHSGAYLGVSTDMYFEPTSNAGYVVLANGGTYFDANTGKAVDAFEAIGERLLQDAMSR